MAKPTKTAKTTKKPAPKMPKGMPMMPKGMPPKKMPKGC